jgi:hypothetical protein
MFEVLKTVFANCSKHIKSGPKLRMILAGVLVSVAVLMSLVALPVSANPGLSVSNAEIVTNVTPGQTLTESMTVSIGANDPATQITAQVTGVAQSLQGGYELLDAAQDTGPYSARTFVTLSTSSFQLQPGGSQSVTATIQVPQNAGAGARFAIINFATQPVAGSSGVGIITAVDVPVYLTISGTQLTETGKITGISTSTVTSGQPLNILINFENTGNNYFKVQGTDTVTNAQGQTVGTMSIPLTSSSIIPGMTRQLSTTLTSASTLPVGTYTINSQVTLSDGTVLDQSTSTFNLTTKYVAPTVTTTASTLSTTSNGTTNQTPSLGTVNLTPSSSGLLENSDGSVSIMFPQGAAVTPVQLSLESYDINQIAALPSGITPGSTCFQVEGLTGLLAKNATVQVTYSQADLTAAGDNASKLKLARWGGSNWTVLKTNLDTGLTTISATSNQMGVWAVVVGSTASSGMNWTIIGVIIAVVIIVVLVVVILLMMRRKPKAKSVKS